MGRKWLLSLLCLLVVCLLVVVQSTSARFELRVNEAKTKLTFNELAPELALVVENGGKPLVAEIKVELIDTGNRVVAAVSDKIDLKTGSQRVLFTRPTRTRDFSPEEKSDILWYRLRYQVTPLGPADNVTAVGGIVSVSSITPDLFDLRVATPEFVRGGTSFKAMVKASHPISNKPAANVVVKGLIELENDDSGQKTRLTKSATTNQDGIAYLEFTLPRDLGSDDVELTVEGSRGLLIVDAERDLEVYSTPFILVSTDKPLYQPGQTIFARVLMLDSSRHALPNKDVSLKITNGDGDVVYQTDLKTSRFGVASAEWVIPEGTKLGDFSLEFETDDDVSYTERVKVSRYDLPNFSVNVKPDQPYYLDGQNATVEVKADYLFGKPVSRGRVRVVRETERNWNYREQKYDTVEGDKYEGDANSEGIFKAEIDLAKEHKELKESDYRRLTDISYAAYFTDPSTNRTEQRRFNLRLTKDAIHVYIVRSGNNYEESNALPLSFYVSTSFADGSPAQCNVDISQDDDSSAKPPHRAGMRVKTNRYGLAKVDNFKLSLEERSEHDTTLNFLVTDNAKRTGHHSETFNLKDRLGIRVTTRKTIFAPGEPVEVTLTSSEPNPTVTLAIARDWTLLSSQVVHLKNYRATVLLPYRPEYQDDITLAAYTDRRFEETTIGTHSIIFPRDRDLKLKLQAEAQTYQPGESAHVTFKTVSSAGRSVESALGVVVVDQAVQERIRTDQDFGSSYSGFYGRIMGLFGSDAVGNITRKSLDKLDLSKPIPPDLDLAAEVLVNQGRGYYPSLFGGSYERNHKGALEGLIEAELKPLRKALETTYLNSSNYPTDEPTLIRILSGAGIDFRSLKDPWGTPYRAAFSTDHTLDVMVLNSAGPDKQLDTEDDFEAARQSWAYFVPTGNAINRATTKYHERTGGYVTNYPTLRDELFREGVNLDQVRDHWGKPYKFYFTINGTNYSLSITTIQPPAPGTKREMIDEFSVWLSNIDYFAETRSKIDLAIANFVNEKKVAPQNESELSQLLKAAGIDLAGLRDPWARPYYTTFKTSFAYADNTQVEVKSNGEQKVTIKPATRASTIISLLSAGIDKEPGNYNDFPVATFHVNSFEQSATDPKPIQPKVIGTFSGATGAITGIITDPQGAVVAGATVKAMRTGTAEQFEASSDDSGKYLIRNLPAGPYELRAEAPGFKFVSVTNILVRSSTLIEINMTLEVGAVTETVNVTAANNFLVESMQTATSTSVKISALGVKQGPTLKQQLSTPRIRGFFPETLLWQPELTTDKQGRASLDFKLADNITTWKMSVIGSTEDGEIGMAETDIRAFQPFFAELDPPRVLTEGDRISPPVVLRNYLDKKQSVDLELRPEQWFSLQGPNRKRTDVAAGESAKQSFELQATTSVKDGKQLVTAIGSDFSDAIEKPITVHPDGEEKIETKSDLLDTSTTLTLELPDNAIPKSSQTELKVYPNLISHVWESAEAIMKRPYGCGEQTISSTYPSVLVLRYLDKDQKDSAIANKARRYVESGYQRLLNYQTSDGGFGYWSGSSADVGLTAYPNSFLNDAGKVYTIDRRVLENARSWLIKQQRSDGSWAVIWDKKEDYRRTAMVTAVVARSLALTEPTTPASSPTPLVLALNYLQKRSAEIDEPYLIASYALATALAKDTARSNQAIDRLISLAHSENNSSYWTLETNTPFYGWGLAGRIETTALVVQALTQYASSADQQTITNLRARGLLFLLRNKDRYGVWYSTQATINVLDAMLALISGQESPGVGGAIEVVVNGQKAKSLDVPSDKRMIAPLMADISSFIKTGTNQVELRRSGGRVASVQLVNSFYVPWSVTTNASEGRKRSGDSESLLLETSFDKQEAHVMDEVTCSVKAERIGFKGYGMMLAEIGLLPGVDVDRESLETAMHGAEYAISQYDILPDRVVFYLWPRAGGSNFKLMFRPRLAMNAKNSSSTVYDYYNPEAKAVIAPSRFVVR